MFIYIELPNGKCPICLSSDRFRDLATHIRFFHKETKILCCPVESCRKTCVSLHQLIYHCLWNHNKPWYQAVEENPRCTHDTKSDAQEIYDSMLSCRCDPDVQRTPLQQLTHKRVLSLELQKIEQTVIPLLNTVQSIAHQHPQSSTRTEGRLRHIREYETPVCDRLPQELELLVPYTGGWW